MNKTEFLRELAQALRDLPEKDRTDSLDYYGEMIDDRTEAGMSEEEAVAELGSPKDAARDIMLNLSLPKLIKSKCRVKRKLQAWEIVLLALGSPIWLSLIIAAVAVALTVYACIWAVFASLLAADIGLVACGLVGFGKFVLLVGVAPESAIMYLGMGFFSSAASVLLFIGCLNVTRVFIKATVWVTKSIKRLIIGKRDKI